MAFHEIPTRIILNIIRQGEDLSVNALIGLTVSAVILVLFIAPIIIIKKYFPILAGGKKK